MKKIFMAFAMFAMLFCIVSCSKKEDNNKKEFNYKGYSISVAVTEVYTVDIDNLVLAPGQQIHLKATIKDARGNITVNTPVNWSASSELGSFSQNTAEYTTLIVSAASGDNYYIKAEFGGVEKTIPVIVDTLNVSFQLDPLEAIIYPEAGMRSVKVTIMRSGGQEEDTNSIVIWNAAKTPGNFVSYTTKSGEWNGYQPAATLFGSVQIYVIINGLEYVSPSYTVAQL
ncbi:MAG: hypothetical protein LBD46_07090 [Endomicrobium sp.]|jgi:hypothetical protein|nr:hypothetical protein [Endomicrobium sp.]